MELLFSVLLSGLIVNIVTCHPLHLATSNTKIHIGLPGTYENHGAVAASASSSSASASSSTSSYSHSVKAGAFFESKQKAVSNEVLHVDAAANSAHSREKLGIHNSVLSPLYGPPSITKLPSNAVVKIQTKYQLAPSLISVPIQYTKVSSGSSFNGYIPSLVPSLSVLSSSNPFLNGAVTFQNIDHLENRFGGASSTKPSNTVNTQSSTTGLSGSSSTTSQEASGAVPTLVPSLNVLSHIDPFFNGAVTFLNNGNLENSAGVVTSTNPSSGTVLQSVNLQSNKNPFFNGAVTFLNNGNIENRVGEVSTSSPSSSTVVNTQSLGTGNTQSIITTSETVNEASSTLVPSLNVGSQSNQFSNGAVTFLNNGNLENRVGDASSSGSTVVGTQSLGTGSTQSSSTTSETVNGGAIPTFVSSVEVLSHKNPFFNGAVTFLNNGNIENRSRVVSTTNPSGTVASQSVATGFSALSSSSSSNSHKETSLVTSSTAVSGEKGSNLASVASGVVHSESLPPPSQVYRTYQSFNKGSTASSSKVIHSELVLPGFHANIGFINGLTSKNH